MAQTDVLWKGPDLMRPGRVEMVLRSFPKEATLAANLNEGTGSLSTR